MPAGPGRLPNLLVIGAQKAGTTWLHRRLAEHPQVLMSRKKELNLFGQPGYAARLDEYRANFPTTEGKLLYGESTPGYFWTHDPRSPWSARYLNGNRDIPRAVLGTLGPETRLLVSLRHPVDRAVSAFFHHYRRGRVGRDDRLAGIADRFGLVDIGFYTRHWQVWSTVFAEAPPRVVLFDRIAAAPHAVMAEVCAWLGLAAPPATRPEPDHAGFRMRVHGGALEIDPEDAANRALAARWQCDLGAAPRVWQGDLDRLGEVFRDEIAACQARWAGPAGHDWTAPRKLADFLGGAG